MKKMKKLITLLLTVLLLLNFTACGKIKEEDIIGSWKLIRYQTIVNDRVVGDDSEQELEERINEYPAEAEFTISRILFNSNKTFIIENVLGDTMDEGTWSIVNSTDIELVDEFFTETYKLEEGVLIHSYVQDLTKEPFTMDTVIEQISTYSKEN